MPMKTRIVTKLSGAAFAAAAAFFAAAIGGLSAAVAAERPPCAVPDNLLFGSSRLNYVSAAIAGQRKLTVVVVGTGSSALAGPDGPPTAYPARLEAANVWIVDPIDGTRAYLAGQDDWTISVGLAARGRPTPGRSGWSSPPRPSPR